MYIRKKILSIFKYITKHEKQNCRKITFFPILIIFKYVKYVTENIRDSEQYFSIYV